MAQSAVVASTKNVSASAAGIVADGLIDHVTLANATAEKAKTGQAALIAVKKRERCFRSAKVESPRPEKKQNIIVSLYCQSGETCRATSDSTGPESRKNTNADSRTAR